MIFRSSITAVKTKLDLVLPSRASICLKRGKLTSKTLWDPQKCLCRRIDMGPRIKALVGKLKNFDQVKSEGSFCDFETQGQPLLGITQFARL